MARELDLSGTGFAICDVDDIVEVEEEEEEEEEVPARAKRSDAAVGC